jgi:ATP-dependent exoDNAse (exonuclease V) alpha subunit
VTRPARIRPENQLQVDRRTVIVVDEASMVGTPELRGLFEASTAGRAKIVLVGDAHQLSPVKARGGMFEHLCDDLPWSQRLGEVWRLRDPGERDASLALRSARGNRLRKAVGWYRTHDRLHTGDAIAMAGDARDAYLRDRAAGKDALLICDTWELADALNLRLHDTLSRKDAPSVAVSRDQSVRVGDLIISRHNDAHIRVRPGAADRTGEHIDQVRNGNRWRVTGVDPATKPPGR